MQLLHIAASREVVAASVHSSSALEALAGVISSIGTETFGPSVLAQLNRWMPFCWLSVYRLLDDAPPTVHALATTCGGKNGPEESWQVYRTSLYRRDETFQDARATLERGSAALLHWHASDICLEHRHAIYTRHGLRERLSLVCLDEWQGLLAVNLYRNDAQPSFTDLEIDQLRDFAHPLLASTRKHISIANSDAPRSAARDALAELPRREREVCERLLKGWTYDGIAADLKVGFSSVKTYRDRAFERLGLHHRNELFALVAKGRSD